MRNVEGQIMTDLIARGMATADVDTTIEECRQQAGIDFPIPPRGWNLCMRVAMASHKLGWTQALERVAKPSIDMILHCPACHTQHIDEPEPAPVARHYDELPGGMAENQPWTNPPHRSHLCKQCGHIWRPADVPTNGVAAIKTKGENDCFDDEESETTLAESCTAGLLEGEGASEDHETFIQALRAAGLSEATAKEVHRRTLTHPDAPNMATNTKEQEMLIKLRAEAVDIFDGPETAQSVRDVIEWYDASIRVALATKDAK